ncbi:putative mitochondrial inner membrane protease atp23 [Melampsora americana]|nr:putative mitochondrial inner membrane protease atp23 [Melampsora americana]
MASSSTNNQQDDDVVQDQFSDWTRRLRMLTGLGLQNDEERRAFLISRCESWRDNLIETSPVIRFMLQHISVIPSRSGSESQVNRFPIPIRCEPCAPVLAGGQFSPAQGGQIRLCSDRLSSRQHASDVLTHELIHAWDDRQFGIDWSNARHIACTEIRANALSGDCRWTRELDRHIWSFAAQRQNCARRRAALSLSQHPSLRERFGDDPEALRQAANRVVDEVWESCWNDTRPFDEIY